MYRPGATEADVLAFRAALHDEGSATHPDREAVPDFAVRRPARVQHYLLGLGAAIVIALIGMVWATSAQRPQTPHLPLPVLPLSTPIPFVGAHRQQEQQRADLHALFKSRPTTPLRSFLLEHGLAGLGQLRSDVHTVIGRGTGTTSFDLGGLSNGAPTGQLTLLFTCDRHARYRWEVTSPGPLHDDPTTLARGGLDCSGHIIASSFEPRVGRVPQTLTLAVAAGTGVLVEVDLARE